MNTKEKITQLAEYINQSENIVFLGGAGVSTESGIPDFRSSSGLYNSENSEYNVSPETILSRTYFFNKPEKFYDFYKTKMLYPNARPNDAHKILAKLEEKGKIKAVVTQNVDNLHQDAGSKNVIELHGGIKNNFCLKCRKKFDLSYITEKDGVPYCDDCGGLIKPDVVLYEEQLNQDSLSAARSCLIKADMLIVGGTSLAVNTAIVCVNWFFDNSRNMNNKSVIINSAETQYDEMFDLCIKDKIGGVLSSAYRKLYGE